MNESFGLGMGMMYARYPVDYNISPFTPFYGKWHKIYILSFGPEIKTGTDRLNWSLGLNGGIGRAIYSAIWDKNKNWIFMEESGATSWVVKGESNLRYRILKQIEVMAQVSVYYSSYTFHTDISGPLVEDPFEFPAVFSAVQVGLGVSYVFEKKEWGTCPCLY